MVVVALWRYMSVAKLIESKGERTDSYHMANKKTMLIVSVVMIAVCLFLGCYMVTLVLVSL